MSRVAIVGCGVVGAAIAYELSKIPHLSVTVIDPQPAQASTGAALGILMGVISHKIKGKAWQRRWVSLQRYETLIPELESQTGQQIPYNRQGLLKIYFTPEEQESWENLVTVRQSQNIPLELLSARDIESRYPQLNTNAIAGAVFSPRDRQIHPSRLTQTLMEAAKQNGVTFHIGVAATDFDCTTDQQNRKTCTKICTSGGSIEEISTDWLVVAAGLGSTPLTRHLAATTEIHPVLGQAIHLRLSNADSLSHGQPEPVITGDDMHIVPLGSGEYWVGATVEFPDEAGTPPEEDTQKLQLVTQQAFDLCPELANATITNTWSGLRPRPQGRPAPIIEKLAGYNNVILATGHYRNGVLLAPATALEVRGLLVGE
ncbi:FAD-dependent oxidoreductase [Geitlerinema sp. PCC 9228]|uniref:NAD(P)/FAD-dependent oxidoreductase n=1 Tax=Geitlerinema sp. PCC 9228 TaxID=111611 RepID=UPI0008F9DADA|nr:FAD-dependent oxidoreductase [Geitlerinema sp. PCC 9228]